MPRTAKQAPQRGLEAGPLQTLLLFAGCHTISPTLWTMTSDPPASLNVHMTLLQRDKTRAKSKLPFEKFLKDLKTGFRGKVVMNSAPPGPISNSFKYFLII